MNSTIIPYQIRAKLLQLEPSTDLYWEETLVSVFDEANIEVREEINQQILRPKEIQWNRSENSFEYKITKSLAKLKHTIENERMRIIAGKLSQSIEWLDTVTDSIQISDYLENALNQIDNIPVEDNLNLQREKQMIRRVFLQDVAKLIRKAKIQPIKGARNLSAEEIRCFIIEVFIKQQLLGYWFKPLLPKASELRAHPFFKYYVLKEQVVRKFDIVKTSEFLYLIAPIQFFDHNPYSIRRFLHEDHLEYNGNVYITGLVIDQKRFNDESYKDHIDNMMQKMVTIQSQVHKDVIEIVQDFELFTETKLLPYLMQPLGMHGQHIDAVAQDYVKNIEQMLMVHILMPLRNAVKNELSHIEEFEYIFMSVHRIFSEILSHYRDFKEQPALFFNHEIQLFEYRLLAYLKLIEKRKDEIFIPMNSYEWQTMHDRSQQPMKLIKEILSQQMRDYRDLNTYVASLRSEQKQVQGSFLKKIMKGDKVERDITQANQAHMQIKKQTYLEALAVPKSFPKYNVFIEFESLTSLSELERHYAFPNGDNGLLRLPLLKIVTDNCSDGDISTLCDLPNRD